MENNQNNFLVSGSIERGNNLKLVEIQEQQAMRKAYCKANDLPFEEIEIPTMKQNLSQGSIKILCVIVWLFIIGTIISAFIGDGNFLTQFIGWWL